MPSIADYLHAFVRSASGNAPQLEAQLCTLEARKRELELELQSARLAKSRGDTFIISSGLDTYCPKCWIKEERQATLRPIPSQQSRIDLFRCDHCNYQYEVGF